MFVSKGLFCCCGCIREAAVVLNDVDGIVVGFIERTGFVDEKLFKSLLENIVIGRDDLWSLLIFASVRNFAVEEIFDPVLVPLTALVAGGIDSTMAAVIVLERFIII